MKRSNNFVLNELADQYVLVPFGDKALDFNGVITLNETGKFFWDNMEKETDINKLADLLVDKYKIDKAVALSDTIRFIESLKEDGCIDE